MNFYYIDLIQSVDISINPLLKHILQELIDTELRRKKVYYNKTSDSHYKK